MHPPPGAQELSDAYRRKAAIRQFTAPFILHLGDFARRLVVEDQDFAVDDLFLPDALDDVAGLEIHADRVSAVGDFVVETLDFGKGLLQAVLSIIKGIRGKILLMGVG